jgi:hypothetical protein
MGCTAKVYVNPNVKHTWSAEFSNRAANLPHAAMSYTVDIYTIWAVNYGERKKPQQYTKTG